MKVTHTHTHTLKHVSLESTSHQKHKNSTWLSSTSVSALSCSSALHSAEVLESVAESKDHLIKLCERAEDVLDIQYVKLDFLRYVITALDMIMRGFTCNPGSYCAYQSSHQVSGTRQGGGGGRKPQELMEPPVL